MKKKLTEEDVINGWLTKYHNTTLKEVEDSHPEWMENPEKHTRDFYQTYAVTQEQHDEWHKWMIDAIAKSHRLSRAYVKKHSWAIYLNCAPSIIDDKNIAIKDDN